VNLVQIRSAVPEIFHTQTKQSQKALKQNLTQFTVIKGKKKIIAKISNVTKSVVCAIKGQSHCRLGIAVAITSRVIN